MRTLISALGLLVFSIATNSSIAAAKDTVDGDALYQENCSACHGQRAEGNIDFLAPVLAGYPVNYLLRQIGYFLRGFRTGGDSIEMIKDMIEVQETLSADELHSITIYLSGLEIPVLEQEVQPIVEGEAEGEGLRESRLFKGCSSCHGKNAAGNNELSAPRLTAQYGWYIKSQLVGYRAGHRGTQAEDRFGRQMKSSADAIASEADIDKLVNYLLTLGAK